MGDLADWLPSKRYVVYSPRARRYITLRAHGVRVLTSPAWGAFLQGPVSGPFPEQEAIAFVRWINRKEQSCL